MKTYFVIDPYDGSASRLSEMEMRQSYYKDRAFKRRMIEEQNAEFPTGDPDYVHISADDFTFADYIEQLKNDGILKGERS